MEGRKEGRREGEEGERGKIDGGVACLSCEAWHLLVTFFRNLAIHQLARYLNLKKNDYPPTYTSSLKN